nr:MAG TPA: hypothetical protein [Caudoviricetes sp.]
MFIDSYFVLCGRIIIENRAASRNRLAFSSSETSTLPVLHSKRNLHLSNLVGLVVAKIDLANASRPGAFENVGANGIAFSIEQMHLSISHVAARIAPSRNRYVASMTIHVIRPDFESIAAGEINIQKHADVPVVEFAVASELDLSSHIRSDSCAYSRCWNRCSLAGEAHLQRSLCSTNLGREGKDYLVTRRSKTATLKVSNEGANINLVLSHSIPQSV